MAHVRAILKAERVLLRLAVSIFSFDKYDYF